MDIDQFTGDMSSELGSKDRLHFYYAYQKDKRQEPVLQAVSRCEQSTGVPLQVPPLPDPTAPVHPVRPGVYVCGEYANPASLQWAMASGRRTGEAVVRALQR